MKHMPDMIKIFSIENETQMKEWDQFVLSFPRSTPFHMSYWLKCIQKTYHYNPLLYVSINQTNGHSKHIDGIFPCFHIKSMITGNRLVSIPFSDYGGPLFFEKHKENLLLSELIKNFNGSCKYCEIRSNLENGTSFLPHHNFKLHSLELNSQPELVKRKFNKRTTLYSIRKAENEGVAIKEENSIQGIEIFYNLNAITRKKHGLPPQPFAFMKNIYSHLIAKQHASILLAIHDSRVISAGIFIKFRDTVYYKYNASDPAFLSQKKPNHLLAWHAIQEACQKGFQYFDFGRTAVNNQSLAKYKEMWGAKPIDLPYHFYPAVQGLTSADENKFSYRMFNHLCKNLPDSVLKKVGAVLYKHIG
ncbi:MAG: GNAT family N-acetyltransferase [Desulfobacteraceae bacterium]|nr:MAG: GNAT family N-acetyltransferase [Desulfobacteraceae bacterium]